MRYIFLTLLFSLLATIQAGAQVLKGNIKTQSGDPAQYATVYIQELRQGTTSNTKGDYELKLPAGKYTVIYQSLGFQPVYETIELSGGIFIKNITLPLQYYEIPEVRITGSGEDPAYIVMRKVIGMAPYYLSHVSYYKAEVYLKGNLLINNIPGILRKTLKMESKGGSTTVSGGKKQQNVIKEGDSYMMESFNEIQFTAPDKYNQRVLSFNSTFPEQGNEISPMDYIQASFYQPVLAEMAISPLSPQAFSYYKFKYLGSSMQGNYTINKIQVIPKRKSQQLFEGTIFIVEDLWCLHSVDLVNDNLIGKIRIKQLYIPVQDDIWMPVSHNFDINIDIVGFRADATYGSSVKYLEVRKNTALRKPETVSTNYTGKTTVMNEADSVPISKNRKQINKILQKDELSNRDMMKLSKLMEKESEKSITDSTKQGLEVKDNITHVIDNNANKRDSAYWAKIRPIPLTDIDKKSLRLRDSLRTSSKLQQHNQDSIPVQNTKKESHKISGILRDAAFGYTWRDTTGLALGFGGLIDLKNFSFNTVDGFIYGLNFNASKSWKKSSLYVAPQFKWAFSRERFIWRVNSFYKFNRVNQSQLYLRAGQTSTDINTGGGINLFLNANFSLLLKKNNLKLYESGYFTLGYMTELMNGINLDLAATYEDRRTLENTTTFSLFKSKTKYTPNAPVNEYLQPGAYSLYALRNMRHADFVTKVTITPFQKYRVVNKRRIPEGSDWPTFALTWQHGFNEFTEFTDKIKNYDMLRFEAWKKHDMGPFREFTWRIRTGGFLDNRYVTFYDFYHVNSQPLPVLLNSYEDAFMLPAFYSLSTPEYYFQAHTKYTTPYLLLKYLPFLSNTLLRENVSVSYLGSRYHKNYTELGYSISEIFFMAQFGVYVGFEDLKYKSVGVSLLLRFQ